jgi:hypothetical protein
MQNPDYFELARRGREMRSREIYRLMRAARGAIATWAHRSIGAFAKRRSPAETASASRGTELRQAQVSTNIVLAMHRRSREIPVTLQLGWTEDRIRNGTDARPETRRSRSGTEHRHAG